MFIVSFAENIAIAKDTTTHVTQARYMMKTNKQNMIFFVIGYTQKVMFTQKGSTNWQAPAIAGVLGVASSWQSLHSIKGAQNTL